MDNLYLTMAGIVFAAYGCLRYAHRKGLFWVWIASIVSTPRVADWLIERSKRTPYFPITARGDETEIYMHRWWLFNAYRKDANDNTTPGRWQWLGFPSIRVHHIMRADDDGHLHDHPWNARTILLRGWYREERPLSDGSQIPDNCTGIVRSHYDDSRMLFTRTTGYTGSVQFEQYHRISQVSNGGVYTLWFTWRYRGTWGFLVDGVKVPYRKYLGME